MVRDGAQTLAIELVATAPGAMALAGAGAAEEWVLGRLGPGGSPVRIGRNLIVTLADDRSPESVFGDQPLVRVRSLTGTSWLLQAPTAGAAIAASAALGQRPGVLSAYPSYRRLHARLAGWAPAPNDPYFDRQGYLDTPATGLGAVPFGADLAIRSAWATARGEGVIVAICDDGLDARHPDLAPNIVPDLNLNFFTRAASSAHSSSRQYHGTCVGGIVAARDGNGVGIAGTAPRAGVCGWLLFDRFDSLLEIAVLAELFQHANDRVGVQNHSWGNADFEPLTISNLEANALSNSVVTGRQGRGVVHVRAAGNTRVSDYLGRSGVGEANLDGFANSPWAITVGAVRADGRVASYSTAGSCILVSALGGERADGTGPFSLDPVGNEGYNTISGSGVELANYVYPGHNEVGTSFTTPQISGLSAVLLSARPDLSSRDVALVLALSARPLAPDPVTQTNGAGLLTGDNVGFGVPHAGRAVELARRLNPGTNAWTEIHRLSTNRMDLPDDGFRVQGFAGDGTLQLDIGAGVGSSALWDTRQGRAVLEHRFPMTDVGKASAALTNDLRGRVALMERRPGTFEEKLNFAADAGAVAGIIADDIFNPTRTLMLRSEFARIPGAFISQSDGAALRDLLANDPVSTLQLVRRPARIEFAVTESVAVHWVQVRTRWDHPRQGDLRVSLISPAGTVSLLQRPNTVEARQLDAWTYGSKQFLLEGAAGTWTVECLDESPQSTGAILEVELILHGTALSADTDHDGLEDAWENKYFGDLRTEPGADPDGDGLTNAAEQALGTDPTRWDGPAAELVRDGVGKWRLLWPAAAGRTYRLEATTDLGTAFGGLGTAVGRAPISAWMLPQLEVRQFFRIQETAP